MVSIISSTCKNTRTLKQDVEVKAEVLGVGKTQVFLGRRRAGGAPCAVKSLSKVGRSMCGLHELKNEAEIHFEMDHPHVLRLDGVYETPSDVHLVMERLEGGELFDQIANDGAMAPAAAAKVVVQMLSAVAYMHGRGLLHMDLKLENFMYEHKDRQHLKVIDFGFARRWDGHTKLSEGAGTIHYMAPETLLNSFDDKADMWSLGVMIYLLLKGAFPWKEDSEEAIIKQLQSQSPPEYWVGLTADLPKDAGSLVQSLLSWSPVGRPSAAEALEHPWLRAALNDGLGGKKISVSGSSTASTTTPCGPLSRSSSFQSDYDGDLVCSKAKKSVVAQNVAPTSKDVKAFIASADVPTAAFCVNFGAFF